MAVSVFVGRPTLVGPPRVVPPNNAIAEANDSLQLSSRLSFLCSRVPKLPQPEVDVNVSRGDADRVHLHPGLDLGGLRKHFHQKLLSQRVQEGRTQRCPQSLVMPLFCPLRHLQTQRHLSHGQRSHLGRYPWTTAG